MKKKTVRSALAMMLAVQMAFAASAPAFAAAEAVQAGNQSAVVLQEGQDIPVYLSDMNWKSSSVGYSNATKDKDMDGNPLKLVQADGSLKTYSKGIFAHAPSEITYDIEGKGVKSFHAEVGINSGRDGASCAFIVKADDKVLKQTGVIRGNAAAETIDVEIPADTKLLTLISTDGGDNKNNDHSVWGDAQIVLDGTVQKNLKKVTLQASNSILEVGKTSKITAAGILVDDTKAEAFDSLSFESGDTSIATVDSDGVVTGVANGVVTITCAATLGDITKTGTVELIVGTETQGTTWSIQSPDGSSTAVFALNADGKLSYSVLNEMRTVLGLADTGIVTSLGDFSSGLTFKSVTDAKEINETYSVISSKKDAYVNHAMERTITFEKDNMEFDVIVRAYDDGVAFRYAVRSADGSEQDMTISHETTAFQVPAGSKTWAMAHGTGGAWSYEDSFYEKQIEDVTGGQSIPLLYETPEGDFTLLTEAELSGEYIGSMVKAEGNGVLRVSYTPQQGTKEVVTSAPFQSPWRVAITGTLADIVENTMVENLSAPEKTNFNYESWAEPGLTSWSWIAAGQTSANQHDPDMIKRYIDFTAEMGWKYYILDEGWQPHAPSGSDSRYAGYYEWFDEIVDYADSKGVGLIAWVICDDLNTQAKRDARLIEWAEKGIKGIKIDFFDRETQDRTQLFTDVYEQCSDLKMVVNVHGANKPTGEIRTYQNVLTREAIRGQEQGDLKPEQYTILPFTRGAVGPADVTETLYPRGSSSTIGFQIASSILIQSGLHCMASGPDDYLNSPTYSLYKDMPAVWDDTKLIDAYPGDFVTMVRRSGENWFGASTTTEARDAEFPLDFLGDGKYYALVYKDTGTSRNDIAMECIEVTKADKLTIPMKKGGGCAVKIVKEKPAGIASVTLNKNVLSMEARQKVTLKADVTLEENALIKTVNWTSSDESVATVSATGEITAVAPGTAVITAVSPVDPTIKAECALTVIQDKYIINDETWSVVNDDLDKVRYNSENSITITSQQGEIGEGTNTLDNIFATVPADQDFAISVKVTGGLTANYQAIALTAFTDTANVVSAMRRYHSSFGNNCFAMVRNEKGQGMTETPTQADTNKDADAYLKLVKKGKTFTSYYSYDGVNWTEIRSQDAKGDIANADAKDIKIGVYTSTGNSAAYKDATFTDFTYYPGESTEGTVIPFAKLRDDISTYTVAFDSQGADVEATPGTMDVVFPATTVTGLPSKPEREGYTFGGWFTEPDGKGAAFTTDTEVTGNMTVYAYWIQDDYVLGSDWSVINKVSDNLAINSENSVSITMQEGEIGGTLRNVLTTAPADQNFAISVKVSGGLTDDFQSAALAVMTDTNNVVAAMRRHHSFFEDQCFAMIAGGVEKPYKVDTQKDQDAYLKLVKNGAMFTSYYSYDGENWTEIRSQEYNNLKDVAAEDLRIGVYASTGNSSKYKPVTFTDFTYYPADSETGTVIPFAKSNKPVVPDEGTLSVKYDNSVALTVNGEAQKLADLLGKYEVKKVEADTPYTLAFKPRVEGKEFSFVSVNGVNQEIRDTESFTYEFTTDGKAQELNFVFAQVDKRILRNLITYAQDYAANNDMESLAPVVKKKFETALADAATVRDTVAVTQDEVNDAWTNLLNAVHMLSFVKGDKAELTELVDYANSIETENFTPNSVAAFEAALAAAQEVLDDENALQPDVKEAYDTLRAAALALVDAASVENLQNLVDMTADIDLSEYIDIDKDDFKAYRDALAEAESVLEDKNATQKQVDEAADALVKAIGALRKTPNKDALRDLVAEVETLDLSVYTPESAARVRTMMANALRMLNNEDATQEEIDGMETELNDAYKALETKKNNKPSGGSSSSSSGSKRPSSDSGTAVAVPAAVVNAAQNVKAAASVRSDTTLPFTLKRGQAYCFKMTVLNGSTAAPSFTVGNSSVLKTQFVAKVGNDYYYRVWAVGTPGESTGVYTTMVNEAPQQHCTVTIG